MKNVVFVSLIPLLLSTTLFATWALIPLDELVDDSDLIIIGTLHSATENSDGLGTGYILMDQVMTTGIKTSEGRSLRPGDNLKITWADNWACAMDMHLGWANKKGIWLLKIENDGTVKAGYPGRFRDLDELTNIRNLMSKRSRVKTSKPVVLASDELFCAFRDDGEMEPIPLTEWREYDLIERDPWPLTIFVLFASIFLYWFLYRSRFRIR